MGQWAYIKENWRDIRRQQEEDCARKLADIPPSYKDAVRTPAEEQQMRSEERQREKAIGCIELTVYREKPLPSLDNMPDWTKPAVGQTPKAVKESVRRFMHYTLAVDYNSASSLVLTRLEHEHYISLACWLLDFYWRSRTGASYHALDSDPRLLPLLYTPTKALGIPLDTLISAAIRYLRAFQEHGEYRPCLMGVLQRHGFARLAEKIHLDSTVVVQGLTPAGKTRGSSPPPPPPISEGVIRIQTMYFTSIGPSPRPINHWSATFAQEGKLRVPYELNARGKAEQKRVPKTWFPLYGWSHFVRYLPVVDTLTERTG